MQKHATTDPNRVADLVKGGGLKLDTLKKRKLAWSTALQDQLLKMNDILMKKIAERAMK